MAEEPRDRENRTTPERERHVERERRVERGSNTTGIAAVIGGLVIAVLLIWWLVGGFGGGGDEQIVLESDVETTEQVGTGVEGEAAPALEGDVQEPALDEGQETQTVE